MSNFLASFLAEVSRDELTKTFQELVNQLLPILLGVAGAVSVIYGVFLGWKFWHAGGDEGKRKDAKISILYFVLGIVVIFAVIVGAPLLISYLKGWAEDRGSLASVMLWVLR